MDELNNNDVLGSENEVIETSKKRNILKVVFGVLGIVIVLGLVLFFVFVCMSPKYRYFSLVGEGFSSLVKTGEKFGDSVFGRILNIDFENKLDMNTEISANVETEDAEILEWLNGFKNVKLIANEKSDFNNEYFGSDIKVILNGEEFILAELLRKNNIFSVNVNDITDGYISVDNNKLSELWEKIGYEGPDKFTSQLEIIKEFNISSLEINELEDAMIRIGKAFTKAFNNEDFSLGDDTVNYNKKSIDAKYIDFKMNSYEMNNGVILALEQLLKEDKAIDVIFEILSVYYKQSGDDADSFTREELVADINSMLNDVKLFEFSKDDGMIIRLYYEGKDIIKVEIFNMNYTNSILKLVMIDDGLEKYYEYTNEYQSFVDNVYMAEKGVYTHTIDMNYINYETGEFLEDISETIILTVDNSVKDICKVITTFEDGIVTYSLVGNIEGNKKNITFDMTGKDEVSSDNLNIKLDVIENAEFEEKVVHDSFNVSDVGMEELEAKKNMIVNNWNEFSQKNAKKIVQLYTAISIYMGLMA